MRPFVTDDARIIERGQLELEMWPELTLQGGSLYPGFHMMGGVSVTEWLEIIVGGGVGWHDGLTVANPVIQPKFLLWRAEEDGIPGLALATGVTLPVGQGEMFDAATGFFGVALLTSRLFNDFLMLHVNGGFTAAAARSSASADGEAFFRARPYWGVGFDAGVVHQDFRLIGEAYAGDPFEALGARYAFQWGGRWLASDTLNLDLTFGAQPQSDAFGERGPFEYWAQIGVRLLFDAFRDTPGDPNGAPGLLSGPATWGR